MSSQIVTPILMPSRSKMPTIDQCCSVRNRLPQLDVRSADIADQSRNSWQQVAQTRKFRFRAFNEVPPLHKVARRVSANNHLGKDYQVCFAVSSHPGVLEDLSNVSFEVSDSSIDLGECDFHLGNVFTLTGC